VRTFAEYMSLWEPDAQSANVTSSSTSASTLVADMGMECEQPPQSGMALLDSSRDSPATIAVDGAEAPAARSARRFKYDVAISFAGPQRQLAQVLARAVRDAGFEVFYDQFYPEELLGKEVTVLFDNIFRKQSRFCVILVSAEYGQRMWTTRERQSAVARAVEERGNEYILPVEVEKAETPGLLPTVGHLSLADRTIEEIAELLKRKLRAK
jgi:hypothetical protein